MSAFESKADGIRRQGERATARNERERDAARAVTDAESRHKAIAAKTIRLRQLRLARDAAASEAAAALEPVPPPAKKARRKSAAPAKQAKARSGE